MEFLFGENNTIYIVISFVLIIVLSLGFYYYHKEKIDAFNRLRKHNVDKVKDYIESYDVLYSDKNTLQVNSLDDFNNNVPLIGYTINNQWDNMANLYSVLHDLCRIGGLTKMYIPPQMNTSTDIKENQELVEKYIGDLLEVKPNEKLLELGCGCGAIAETISNHTKCHVTGINIDEETLEKGRQHLKKQNNDKVKLLYADINNPLEFPDNSFDGIYNVQGMTFSNNLSTLFKEIFRVLKPGKKVVIMDGVVLDKFDKSNSEDINNIIEAQKVCAGGGFWHPKYWEKSGTDAGFNVIKSTCGDKYPHQYANELPLLIDVDTHYKQLEAITEQLCNYKILPNHLNQLFKRLREGSNGLIELQKQNKFTTNYYLIFEKPLS